MSSIRHAVRRRWWLIVLAPLLAILTASLVSDGPTVTHRADAVLFVPSGAGADGPGGANEAALLAQQYTQLIAADESIVGHVAAATATTVEDVRDALSLVAPRDSSLLRISYASDDPGEAIAGLTALIEAATEGLGGQTSIPAGFLQVVDRDEDPTREESGSRALLIAAALGGIALGIAGALALERADVRVDDIDLAVERTGVPGSDLDAMTDPSLAALLRHWADLAPAGDHPVAMLGVEQDQIAVTESVVDRLARVGRTGVDGRPTTERPADLRIGGAPGTVEAGEWIAADSALTVLVVPRGGRLVAVERAVAALRQLQLGPAWMVLADRPRGGPGPDPAPGAETHPVDADRRLIGGR